MSDINHHRIHFAKQSVQGLSKVKKCARYFPFFMTDGPLCDKYECSGSYLMPLKKTTVIS